MFKFFRTLKTGWVSRKAFDNSARDLFETIIGQNSQYDQSYVAFARQDPDHWRDRILEYLSEEYDKVAIHNKWREQKIALRELTLMAMSELVHHGEMLKVTKNNDDLRYLLGNIFDIEEDEDPESYCFIQSLTAYVATMVLRGQANIFFCDSKPQDWFGAYLHAYGKSVSLTYSAALAEKKQIGSGSVEAMLQKQFDGLAKSIKGSVLAGDDLVFDQVNS